MSIPSSEGAYTQLRTGKPWWRVCGCGCLILLIALGLGLAAAWRAFGGFGGIPQQLNSLPPQFPPSISVYAFDQVDSIEYLPGSEKHRFFSMLVRPLLFFSSVVVTVQPLQTSSTIVQGERRVVNSLMDMDAMQLQQLDNVTLQWTRLAVSKETVIQHYTSVFQQNGYAVDGYHSPEDGIDVILGKRSDATAQVQIQDTPDTPEVDSIILRVEYRNTNP